MVATGSGAITRSDIETWDFTHLETAATHWSTAAQEAESQFTTIHSGMLRPGGTEWAGTAADTAVESSWRDVVKVRGAGDALYTAARHATVGAGDLSWAKQQALSAIEEAEAAGFIVEQDLSVRDSTVFGPPSRRQQAIAFGQDIHAKVQALAALDKKVAAQITSALAPLETLQFPENRKRGDPAAQMVDYGFKQDSPVPPPPPSGPNGQDIAKVLDQLPSDSRPNIKVVRSQADIDRLWQWMKQNGVDNPGRYGGTNGVSVDLPDGTSVGERAAARSTGQSALDVNVPGRGYIKVHINPDKGAEPNIPAPKAPVEAPKVAEPEAPRAAPPPAAEAGPAAKPAPVVEPAPAVKPTPGIGGWGGPSAEPFGPQPVHPPGSINHPFPILGEDNPNENPRDFEGH